MKRVIKWGQLVFPAMLSSALYAQTPPTLEVLIEHALRKDHTLANRQLDIEATRIDGLKLKEVYLPTVDLSGKYAYMAGGLHVKAPANKVPELGINLPALDNKFNTHSQLVTGGLKTDVVLYTGGKVPYLRKAVNEKIGAQTALLEKDRQQLIGQVSEAYDQLALLKQVRIVLEESRKRLQINAETADKALGYGLITKYEHQKIEVARAKLEAQALQYEGKRQLLIQLLHMYTDLDPAVLETIDHELAPMAAGGGNSVDGRPEIAALNAGIAAHRYAEKAAQSWWKPKVQLSAGVGYLNAWDMRLKAKEAFPTGNVMELKTNQLQLFPNFNVGVGFKWDLFDGNKGKREVQQARIETKKAENEKAEALEKLQLNLIMSETAYTNALAEIRVTEKQRQSAENALHQATKEFKTGLVKASDLIGAETDYQSASLDYLQAVFNQRRTVVELLKATGSLTPQALK